MNRGFVLTALVCLAAVSGCAEETPSLQAGVEGAQGSGSGENETTFETEGMFLVSFALSVPVVKPLTPCFQGHYGLAQDHAGDKGYRFELPANATRAVVRAEYEGTPTPLGDLELCVLGLNETQVVVGTPPLEIDLALAGEPHIDVFVFPSGERPIPHAATYVKMSGNAFGRS